MTNGIITSSFRVFVKCFTFNHAPYIKDAMNGFTMQQTDFPFVCVIVDDASTDSEPEVIRNYLQENFDLEDKSVCRNEDSDDYVMTFARHKDNHNCYFAVYFLKYNHYSIKKTKMPYITEWTNTKYIALCEGDDYWIDPFKLQKQYDFLESHSEYGLVYTAFRENRNGVLSEVIKNDFGDDCLREYLSHKRGIIATASTMCRADLYLKREINSNLPMGDVPLWIQLMHASKAKFLDDVTTVYRILGESASHSRNFRKKMLFGKSAVQVRRFYAEKYGFPDIAEALYKREKKSEILIDLYDFHWLKFFLAFPWRYGVSLRNVFGVLKKKTLASLNMC